MPAKAAPASPAPSKAPNAKAAPAKAAPAKAATAPTPKPAKAPAQAAANEPKTEKPKAAKETPAKPAAEKPKAEKATKAVAPTKAVAKGEPKAEKPVKAAAKEAPAKAKAEKGAPKAEKGAPKAEKSAPKAEKGAPKAPPAKAAKGTATAAKAQPAKVPAAKGKAPAPKGAQPKAAAPAKKETKSSNVSGIYIKNWGVQGSDYARTLFSPVGKISQIQLRRNKYCQVWFETPAAAKKAIDTIHKDLSGNALTIVAAKSAPKPDKHDKSKVVFVRPVFRQTTTRKQLLTYFGAVGKIVKLRTYVNNVAYIYFDTSAAANKAVADLGGKDFAGHKLTVKLSTRSVDVDKKKEERRKFLIKLFKVKSQPTARK